MGALKTEHAFPRYTYKEYLKWEDKWELIDGYPYMMAPAPTIEHQSISFKIAKELDFMLENCSLCQALLPVDWKINDETVVQPDNLVICHKPKNKNYITKAPKIIFEVLSKSTAKKDTGIKFELYESEGVNYYIIVDPDEKIAKAYELKEGRYIKMGDFSDEKIKFDISTCKKQLTFNMKKIW